LKDARFFIKNATFLLKKALFFRKVQFLLESTLAEGFPSANKLPWLLAKEIFSRLASAVALRFVVRAAGCPAFRGGLALGCPAFKGRFAAGCPAFRGGLALDCPAFRDKFEILADVFDVLPSKISFFMANAG